MNSRFQLLFDGRRRAYLTILSVFAMVTAVHAQTSDIERTQEPRDRNNELRTRTWSIYAQGGLSWATGVWYQSHDAQRSYMLSPALGGGVDFNLRPWVRMGAEYLWSNYRREQNYATLDPLSLPVKAYGNYVMSYHNFKVGAQFNLMEFWSERQSQWLNIWAGTGFGYTIAKGREYGIYFSNTQTQNGVTTPLVDGGNVGNESGVTITGSVQMSNRPEAFNSPFIPSSLHIEADLNRQLTVGVKGELDWFVKRMDITPKQLVFAMVTLRYNFVPGRAHILRTYYHGELSRALARIDDLQDEIRSAKARADQEAARLKEAEARNADLERRLEDCENSKPASLSTQTTSHFVQFDHNSSFLSPSEDMRLRDFAHEVCGRKLSIVAEASTPGTEEYNQSISERRLDHVIKVLLSEGLALEDLYPMSAIGERAGKPSAEGRRVTISIEQ